MAAWLMLSGIQVAYNQAMASCSWEQAWACFHAMRRAGVQPNTRSYNAVSPPLRCSRAAIAPTVCSLCTCSLSRQRCHCRCCSCHPHLISVCVLQLLAACERDGEADRALEAFARMEREAPGEPAPFQQPLP